MTEKTLTERQQFWLEHLRACEKSGLAAAAYARRHGISVSSLYMAKSRARAEQGAARKAVSFVRATPAGGFSTARAPRPCRVSLPNGVVVELALDDGELSKVLQAAAVL